MTARRARLAAFVLVLWAVASAEAGGYRKGQTVVIEGRVSDAAGAPVAEVAVLLELSRSSFRLLKLGQEKQPDTLTLPTATAADGAFAFDWQWDGHHNTFELAVGLPVARDGQTAYEIFLRRDITEQVKKGSPVVVPLVLEDSGALLWLRDFLSRLGSDDERRIYREMGRPDRVDRGEAARPGEESWWYFAAGKVYRLRDGALEQVVHFDPIEPL